MRLKQYEINERAKESPYDALVTVYNNCMPFIKDYLREFKPKLSDNLMWSGRNSKTVLDIKPIRKDRKSVNTSKEMSDIADDAFLKQHGHRFRSNAIFCTGDLKQAEGYGDSVYGIFPIGKYKYCWSPTVRDLFNEFEDNHFIGMSRGDLEDYFDDEMRDKAYWRAESMYADQEENYATRAEWIDGESDWIEDNVDRIRKEMIADEVWEILDDDNNKIETLIGKYQTDQLGKAIKSGKEIMVGGSKYVMVRHDYCMFILQYMMNQGSSSPTPEKFAKAMKGLEPKKYPKAMSTGHVKKLFQTYASPGMMDDLMKN